MSELDENTGAERETGPRPSGSRTLGLKSVEDARRARSKMVRPPARVILWFLSVVAVATTLRWRCTLVEMDETRQQLLAKQRTVEVDLGPRWYPLRDEVEARAIELSATAGDEFVAHDELAKFDFRRRPGLYFRARVDEASSVQGVREASKRSLKDGFTSCLVHGAAVSTPLGQACERTRECPKGQFCNELDQCAEPSQPFNLRTAYKALHILSPEWLEDVRETTNDLRLEVLTRAFEDATLDDLPLAADLLTRATYFLVVLDERPPTRPLTDAEIQAGAARADDVDDNSGATYASRVGLWRLEDRQLLLRVRRTPEATLVGGAPVHDPAIAAARRRQAASCALALEIRRLLGDEKVPGRDPLAPPAVVPPPGAPPVEATASPGTSAAPALVAPPSANPTNGPALKPTP